MQEIGNKTQNNIDTSSFALLILLLTIKRWSHENDKMYCTPRTSAFSMETMPCSPLSVGVRRKPPGGEDFFLKSLSPKSVYSKTFNKGVDILFFLWYNHLNAMTERSRKPYRKTESCRLMRGAWRRFSNTFASVAPERETVGGNGFDRYIDGTLWVFKVFEVI